MDDQTIVNLAIITGIVFSISFCIFFIASVMSLLILSLIFYIKYRKCDYKDNDIVYKNLIKSIIFFAFPALILPSIGMIELSIGTFYIEIIAILTEIIFGVILFIYSLSLLIKGNKVVKETNNKKNAVLNMGKISMGLFIVISLYYLFLDITMFTAKYKTGF